ncbi:hypothetical protein M0R45_017059 [Rubus argutus]|uniref:Uncharacterized protein n=1 Tax=Rubus argutus TaxID=59490 RepID=A0AAW1XWW1_RUBAR
MAGVDRDADIDCAATTSTASVKRRAAVENCGEAVVCILGRGKNWELQRLLEFGLDQGDEEAGAAAGCGCKEAQRC